MKLDHAAWAPNRLGHRRATGRIREVKEKMTIRSIVLYRDDPETLRKVSEPFQAFGPEARRLIRDLKDTLNAHQDGIGLAAPQISVHKRAIVVREGAGVEGAEPEPPMAIVNPEIIQASNPKRDFDGCLSFPGLYGETVRPHAIHLRGLDEEGRPLKRRFEGFDAVVVHHEIDHLDGILFIDRARSAEDLYIIELDEDGQPLRVPLPAAVGRWQGEPRVSSSASARGGPTL